MNISVFSAGFGENKKFIVKFCNNIQKKGLK